MHATTHTNRRKSRRGGTIALVVVSMTALIGLAALTVDVGMLYVHKQGHVNAADAAALAGGMELPDQALADERARQAVAANYPDGGMQVEVSFPSENEIAVRTRTDESLAFAQVFKKVSAPVSSFARARLEIPNIIVGNAPLGLRPWAVDDDTVAGAGSGEPLILKFSVQNTPYDGSNTGIVRLDGPGAATYRETIIYGSQGTHRVGDKMKLQPGNVVGPTIQGVRDLVGMALTNSSWKNQDVWTATIDNPRVILLPIADWDGSGGNDLEILGFGAFYVESAVGATVRGAFTPRLQVANGDVEYGTPSPSADGNTRVLKLIE